MPIPKSATFAGSSDRSRSRPRRSPPFSSAHTCVRLTYNPEGRAAGEPGVVANVVTWYDAAGYCNWLSELAGIPPEQWCYPRELKPGVKIEADCLKRCGYRLPTEAEWEYFCRAGTETSRPFGGSDFLISRYAWTWLSSKDRTYPPGRLLPNEFGLFDTLGNVLEWCQDGLKTDPYRDIPVPGALSSRAHPRARHLTSSATCPT